MNDSFSYRKLYENRLVLSRFNTETELCLYEPEHILFTVKHLDKSAKEVYEGLMNISNPHLAKILYIEEYPDYIDVMQDYVSGISLNDLLEQEKALDEGRAKRIVADVCNGLCAMHRAGLIHRDINPNNIVVGTDGTATVIDFGISRAYRAEKNTDTTILGTPGYAAPEQFGFSQSDARTDIYAVGVLFNVLLTGELPNVCLAGGTAGKIIAKCVEIDYRKRYRSMEALCAAVGNTGLLKILGLFPGLRNPQIPVVILSALCYAAAGLISAALFLGTDSATFFPTLISWMFLIPFPYCLFTDFLGVRERLPLPQSFGKRGQQIVFTLLGIASIVMGLLILRIFETPYTMLSGE